MILYIESQKILNYVKTGLRRKEKKIKQKKTRKLIDLNPTIIVNQM